jgi:enoyl-CoA hydratase/carnithine racemase
VSYLTTRYERVLVESHDGVVVVTLNNPEQMNASTLAMIRELGEILPEIDTDASAKVMVLTGAGDAFAAGGNMKAMAAERSGSTEGPLTRPLWNVPNLTAAQRLERKQTTGLRVRELIWNLGKPTIAAINGPAAGAGMDLALCCDLRVMADSAYMVQSYIRVGVVPFDGAMWLLPRMIGLTRALELMYTGRKVDSAECERIGLVNRVVPRAKLTEETMFLAKTLANGPSVALQLIKHITHEALAMSFSDGLKLSYETRDVVFATEDHHEGVAAFFEKRQPKFQGR